MSPSLTGITPLHMAAYNDHVGAIKILVTAGRDVLAQDYQVIAITKFLGIDNA